MARPQPDRTRETRTIPETGGGRIRIALVFPNTYYVGMSNLGYQTLYRMLCLHPEVTCERFFLPDPKSAAGASAAPARLLSFESGKSLASFDIISFSLSFENDYLNILWMLSQSKIPLLQADRSRSAPLLIAGGISVFLNPEPLADIFDLFIIGEAEEAFAEFMKIFSDGYPGKKSPKPPVESFAGIEGVYVPSAYDVSYTQDGYIDQVIARDGFPSKIICRQVAELDRYPAASCVLTPDTEFSDMHLVEVSRGCPRHCRFCAAGSVYRPFRVRNQTALKNEIVSQLTAGQKKIGLLGSAVSDYPGLADLLDCIADHDGQVSISSLRADALSEDLVSRLMRSGHKTFTIAPEAGSQRLREAIGKQLSTEEIMTAAAVLARCRVSQVRLYFMVGLPTETEEDIHAIGQLTREIKRAYMQEARGRRWLNRIVLSISPFVPKPFTPFQWHPFETIKNLKQKLKIISSSLRKENKVAVSYDLPKWGYVQTLLSRGDRKTVRFLMAALQNQGDWLRSFRISGTDPDFYVYRQRRRSEILPWDFIVHRTGKQQLWEEYQQALGGSVPKS